MNIVSFVLHSEKTLFLRNFSLCKELRWVFTCHMLQTPYWHQFWHFNMVHNEVILFCIVAQQLPCLDLNSEWHRAFFFLNTLLKLSLNGNTNRKFDRAQKQSTTMTWPLLHVIIWHQLPSDVRPLTLPSTMTDFFTDDILVFFFSCFTCHQAPACTANWCHVSEVSPGFKKYIYLRWSQTSEEHV